MPTCFNMATTDKKFDDLNLSKDEVDRLTNALKNEEFRKLFVQYAEEISDPENKARYEAEIAEMEREKGMDVKFIHPEPGYVVKTAVNGETKAFINICKNEHVAKPSSKKTTGPDGRPGLSWSIPHSFAPPRDDTDKSGTKCKVYDFVVNHDTYRMAETNVRFKNILHDTAFDGIEKQFDVKIDRRNLKFPKTKFKGTASATVIRSKQEGAPTVEHREDDLLSKFTNPYGTETTEEKMKKRELEIKKREEEKNKQAEKQTILKKEDEDEYAKPKYSIKHRSEFDFQDFSNARDTTKSRPNELVLEVDLPLMKSAATIQLDIFEQKIVLVSDEPAKYKLDIVLPYPVDENEGSAKFDKGKRKLIISLPVTQPKKESMALNGHTDEDFSLNCDGASQNKDPLIEVISSEDVHENNDVDTVTNIGPEPRKHFSMPEFDCFQDDETVTIILKVTNVIRDSVKTTFNAAPPHGCSVQLTSVGSGSFPMNFSFSAQLVEGCSLEVTNCRVDISSENVAVVLVKSDDAIGKWDKLMVGLNDDQLEEKLMLTVPNLRNKLDMLDSQIKAAADAPNVKVPHLKVTHMDADKLEIDIEGHMADIEQEVSSPESIEVVHDSSTPKLQGILKQRSRTVSESSDDMFRGMGRQNSCSGGMGVTSEESSLLESDENDSENSSPTERKKSVSFCEHIDKTTYKTNASVSTMKATLKGKKRRQRKRDQKQQGRQQRNERRRRNSSGSFSEQSSDEQNLVVQGGIENDNSGDEMDPPVKVISGDVSKSDQQRSIGFDERTSKNEGASQNLISQAVNSVLDAQQKQTPETVDVSTDKVDQFGEGTLRKASNCSSRPNGGSDPGAGGDDLDEDDTEQPAPVEPVTNQDGYKSETMLSWQDKPPAYDPYANEHKTTCGFEFSNSVMFDLDVD